MVPPALNKYKNLVLIGAMSLTVVLIAWKPSPDAKGSFGAKESWDTFIPAGNVLVPIEVENFESLYDMIDRYGIVDLYQIDSRMGARKIASQVKLIRSTVNREKMGVLVSETLAPAIVRAVGPLRVIVKNPGEDRRTPIKGSRKIYYGKNYGTQGDS